jgi:predicted nucleic-acid-binding protein
MLAIDTNVLVRFLTGDHPQQFRRVKALIESEPVFVATTVLLEADWVLRSVYGFKPDEIARAFAAFAGLPGVSLENPDRLVTALEWTLAGMDFADALHMTAAAECGGFVSFDRPLAKLAARLTDLPVKAP